jgi:DnaJ-class molecular chaperone
MPTTVLPKRVVNGLPLTEVDSHHYRHGLIDFTKPVKFWHATAPDGTTTPALFTLADAVTWARSNGWITDVDTCPWCGGHGIVRLADDYFHLSTCPACDGDGINSQQPAEYV